ncbi:unnamed protein product [Clonostachys byssicola]|uniref:Major facilitator superfamily (MFS) profile domain-containing protein n=1 Tax=Clonostachys byssicola TaxID=160290 RepID=A0A9N9UDX7_9HYPO|nr:unnamed protein product [Clonostachys byssicola]
MALPKRLAAQSEDDGLGPNERTTLIGRASPQPKPYGDVVSVTSATSSFTPPMKNPDMVMWILYIAIFIGGGAIQFQVIPMARIYEDAICRAHYERAQVSGPIDESQCKVDAIQSELAFIFAIQEALTAFVSCFVAIPWGIVADKYGRKPVTCLCFLGDALAAAIVIIVAWLNPLVPIRAVWASSLVILIGGGDAVVAATISGIVTDIIPEAQRSDLRGVVFMRVYMCGMVGGLSAPALASALMPVAGPWVLMLVALFSILFVTTLCLFMPETLVKKKEDQASETSAGFGASLMKSLAALKGSLSVFKSVPVTLLFATTFFSTPLLTCTLQFLTVFASKRYHIRLDETGYIQTVYGVAQAIAGVALLPLISEFITKSWLPAWLRISNERRRDLVLLRWSYGVSIIGTLILGFAPKLGTFILGLLVMALGSGANGLIKSLLSLYVDPELSSQLYTITGILEVCGSLYAQPLLAALFTIGMRLGGGYIGLPYFGVTALSVLLCVIVMFVRLPKSETGDAESLNEEVIGNRNAQIISNLRVREGFIKLLMFWLNVFGGYRTRANRAYIAQKGAIML